MAELIEPVEDLQLRAIKRLDLFTRISAHQQFVPAKCHLAVSSRYGICVAVGPQNKLFACSCADIHRLGLENAPLAAGGARQPANLKIRTITHFNPKDEICSIATNSDGSLLSLAVNTPNGPFVEIFDVLCFAVNAQDQPFPLLNIRLSSDSQSRITAIEWNPAETDIFVAVTSDNMLSTIKCSLQSSTNFTVIGTLNLAANCVCWSPKGKQLVVGGSDGRIHQLKPELSPIRAIEAPPQGVPIFGQQPLGCVAICWLSTTEWLVAHRPANSLLPQQHILPTNISLLVVKKQQPPKWVFYGDVLPTARGSNIAFCPLLVWNLVFLYSPDCAQVAVFGQRGENWPKLEFEPYDIELPLTDENKDTFPIGAAFDLSSVAPLQIELDANNPLPPQPFLHLLNSSGQLLPYAIVSLAKQGPSITRAPEHVQLANMRNGQPPPGYVPPIPMVDEEHHQKQPELIKTKTTIPAAENERKQQQQPDRLPIADGDGGIVVREPFVPLQPQSAVVSAEKSEEEKAREEAKKIEALESALQESLICYTKMRNAQTQGIDRLRELRCEVERHASSFDFANLEQLSSARRDLQQLLRQALQGLDKFSADIHRDLETVTELKAVHSAAKSVNPQSKRMSFDTEKRLQLAQQQYDNFLGKMERAKRMLATLEEHQQQQIVFSGSGQVGDDETIDPVEQRKIIQINDNIGRMCAKLDARVQQIRRLLEANRRVGPMNNSSGGGGTKVLAKGRERESTRDMAAFCALELGQLCLEPSTSGGSGVATADRSKQQRQLRQFEEGPAADTKFQQNLFNFLTNKFRPEPTIRRLQPLGTSPQKAYSPHKPIRGFASEEVSAERRQLELEQKVREAVSPSPKPQLVSVGVQSPDFTAKTPAAKGKPQKKEVQKKATEFEFNGPPVTPVNGRRQNASLGGMAFRAPGQNQVVQPTFTFAGGAKQQQIGAQPKSFSFVEAHKQLPSLIATSTATALRPQTPIQLPALTTEEAEQPAPVAALPAQLPVATTQALPVPPLPTIAQQVQTTTTATGGQQTTVQKEMQKRVEEEEEQRRSKEAEKKGTAADELPKTTTTTGIGGLQPPVAPAVEQQQKEQAVVGQTAATMASTTGPGMDEGMEDETGGTAPTAAAGPGAVTFDFMKSGLGSSTPINANRNPFGSINAPSPQSGQASTLFGTANSSTPFGTPASAFGSFGASTPSGGVAPSFGASPFSSANNSSFGGGQTSSMFGGGAASAISSPASGFGGGPTFGTQSPFSAAPRPQQQQQAFGASAFGGGGAGAMASGGGSLFGGGMGGGGLTAPTGATGFSAFASKSSAFGQLASQAQQNQPAGSSLFGGGAVAPGSGTFGGGFGTPSPGTTAFNQPKSSAFTTFRK